MGKEEAMTGNRMEEEEESEWKLMEELESAEVEGRKRREGKG